jgi:hypothetical protein
MDERRVVALFAVVSVSTPTSDDFVDLFTQDEAKVHRRFLPALKTKQVIFTICNLIFWWAMKPWFVLLVEVPLQVGICSPSTI